MNNPYLQELRKLGYDAIANEITEGMKRFENRFKGQRAPTIEGYIEGNYRLQAYITVRINGNSSISRKYRIQLHFDRENLKVRETSDVMVLWLPVSNTTATNSDWKSDANRKFPMLVDSIQFVDLPERVCAIVIPSVMRLERLDDNGGQRVNASDFLLFGFSIHGATMEDGEFGAANLRVGHHGGELLGESKCQMIKCRPKIEKAITNDDAKSLGNDIDGVHSEAAAYDVIAEILRKWFRVWFIDNSIGFSLDPRSELLTETLEMFTSPIEL